MVQNGFGTSREFFSRLLKPLLLLVLAAGLTPPPSAAQTSSAMDEGYTKKIREFSTGPFFLTDLVDHLPASATVPTPEKILGHIAGAPAVVDVPFGRGHIVLFSNNPMWRQETQGSFMLLLNAALHFDHLNAGRKFPGAKPAAPAPQS